MKNHLLIVKIIIITSRLIISSRAYDYEKYYNKNELSYNKQSYEYEKCNKNNELANTKQPYENYNNTNHSSTNEYGSNYEVTHDMNDIDLARNRSNQEYNFELARKQSRRKSFKSF